MPHMLLLSSIWNGIRSNAGSTGPVAARQTMLRERSCALSFPLQGKRSYLIVLMPQSMFPGSRLRLSPWIDCMI